MSVVRLLEAERTGAPEQVVHFGIEDLLCINQKNKQYKEFLNGKISLQKYGLEMMGLNCVKESGVC